MFLCHFQKVERQSNRRSRDDLRKAADELKTAGKSAEQIATALGVSRATAFRLLKKQDE